MSTLRTASGQLVSSSAATRPDVLVAGAGLAGMAAALALARAGLRVHVVETRRKLGGRATSFTDPRSGAELDNCQHVALGCCTHYQHLLAQLGQHDVLSWSDTQTWIEPGGRTSIIRPAPLPAPLHGGPSLLAAKFLSAADKLAITRGIAILSTTSRAAYAGKTFAQFLDDAQQPPRARRRFWEPIIVSACNLPPEACAAGPALKVFQEGFLASASAGRIGVPRVPLANLYDQFIPLLESLGGHVELGTSITQIHEDSLTTADGRTLHARHVLCALPYERALDTIEPDLLARDGRLPPLAPFANQHSPILGIHLAFDRPILPRGTPHAVLVSDEPVPQSTQWLFARDGERQELQRPREPRERQGVGGSSGGQEADAERQHLIASPPISSPASPSGPSGPLEFNSASLSSSASTWIIHAVISAAAPFDGLNEAAVIARVLADIHRHLPDSRSAALRWGRVVREKRATFPCTPGFEAVRPPVSGPRSRLLLAGDYCDIGWPATMEGATRAGHAAAAAIIGTDVGPPDAPIATLLRAAAANW